MATTLPELMRRSNTANIMADVATTPQNATSFLGELHTAPWVIVPVGAADEVAAAAALLAIVVVDTAVDAVGDVAVDEDTRPHMPPTSHMFPPTTSP